MEDRISGGLQHRHKTCCKKGGCRGRRACKVQRWHHRGDVVFQTGGLVYDKDLESLSASSWNLHLILLGHSQNSMEFDSLELKNFHNLLRIAAEWIWKGWTSLSKIFLAAWMESVTTIILETLFREQAWFIPHLIATNSTSVVVTKDVWWTVLISGWFAEWTCEIDVAMSFLMLASVIMIAERGDKELIKTILLSSWARVFLLFFPFSLLTKLKEKWLEKLSMIWRPGKNSGSRGEKEGKIPCDLCYKMRVWTDFG